MSRAGARGAGRGAGGSVSAPFPCRQPCCGPRAAVGQGTGQAGPCAAGLCLGRGAEGACTAIAAEAPVSPEPETDGRILLAALAARGQVPQVLPLLQEPWEPPASCAGEEALGSTMLGSRSVVGRCVTSMPG